MLNSRKENEKRRSNTSLYFPVTSLFPPGSSSARALSYVAPSGRIFLSHLCPFVQGCFLPTTPPQFSVVIRGSWPYRQACKISYFYMDNVNRQADKISSRLTTLLQRDASRSEKTPKFHVGRQRSSCF